MDRQDDDILLLQDSLVEVGTVVQDLDGSRETCQKDL